MQQNQPDSFQVDLTQCKTDWDMTTKIKRGLWQFLVRPLYRLIPFGLSGFRIGILRLFGATIGHNCKIMQRVEILIPWNLNLGDHVALAHDVRILNFSMVTIHSMSIISQYSYLCTGTHDCSDPHFKLIHKPIIVESEAWIASGTFVGLGVTVGRGAVIGANSVVTKDVPEWMICAGNPCRAIKPRVIRSQHTEKTPDDD